MEEKRDTHLMQGRDSNVRLTTSKPYFTETIYQNQKKQITDINEKFRSNYINQSNSERDTNGEYK
jgi:hypothetical protein